MYFLYQLPQSTIEQSDRIGSMNVYTLQVQAVAQLIQCCRVVQVNNQQPYEHGTKERISKHQQACERMLESHSPVA